MLLELVLDFWLDCFVDSLFDERYIILQHWFPEKIPTSEEIGFESLRIQSRDYNCLRSSNIATILAGGTSGSML